MFKKKKLWISGNFINSFSVKVPFVCSKGENSGQTSQEDNSRRIPVTSDKKSGNRGDGEGKRLIISFTIK